MRKQAMAMLSMVLLVVALLEGGGAEKLCNVEQSALLTCASYCRTGSTEGSPSQACCDGLRPANINCFCGYKSQLASYGLDPTRTMQIPSKCGFGPSNPCG